MNKLQKKAEDAKFVRRKSPLDGSVFLQALVLNVFQFGVVVLDQLAKAAHRINPNVEVTGQAFKERFNAAAVEFLKACFVEALKTTAPQAAQVIPLLSAFSEVNLLDSSSVQLPESLKENYPGCGGVGSKAAAKVYLLLDYLTGAYQTMRIEAGRKADQNMGEKFLAGHQPGALWLFDLGFFCAPFLAQIAKLGSFYLCRLAASQLKFFARNAAGELEPFDLDRFLRHAPRQLFEIEVVFGPKQEVLTRLIIAPVPEKVAAERRRKVRHAAHKQGRLPTQKTLNRCSWTLLLSNAKPEQLPTSTVLEVYGVRWQVEICQTQPIKIAWCPLGLFRRVRNRLRGGFKREYEMNIHFFSRDDDFFDQALSDSLSFFKRKSCQVVTQQGAKGFGILNDSLPMHCLLVRLGELAHFLLDLLSFSSQFLPTRP